MGGSYSSPGPTRGNSILPCLLPPTWLPLYSGGTLCKLWPGNGWRVSVKWQQLGLAMELLGTGGLVGLQEKGREGVDFVCPPHLMWQQWQLHDVEVFV